MTKLLLTAFFAVTLAAPALAWDDTGHKITGYIAWQRLSPNARTNIIRILRAAPEDSHLGAYYMHYGPKSDDRKALDYFMFVPTWADLVRERSFETRYRKYHKSNWHYDDTFWRQVDGRVQVLSEMEEGGQAVPRMEEFDKVIRDASASNEQKAIAIAWLLHMGGDIHQPLHTSARVTETEPKGDQGGNLVQLTPKGTPREDQLNLHWFWDSIVGRNIPFNDSVCEPHYIENAGKRIMKSHPFSEFAGKLELGNYRGWQQESFAFITTVVFTPDLQRNQIPSDQYRKRAFKHAERQLALAGYRLGETLNSVFNAPAAANNR
jgi:hypothetical protein